METCGVVSHQKVTFFFAYPPSIESLDYCELLLQKVVNVDCRSRIFPVLAFIDPKDLIQYHVDQIQSLINVFPVDEMRLNKIKLTESDFSLIHKYIVVGQANASLEVQRGSVCLFYALKRLSCKRLNFNFDSFFQTLPFVKFLNCKK